MPRSKIACVFVFASAFAGACGGDGGGDDGDDTCTPDDTDGVAGGNTTFALTVDDTSFKPTILKTQNVSNVTLTLTNAGTKPHGFTVDCIATPNSSGCPTQSCFPDGSMIAPIAPGATATVTFVTPNPEGIYAFHSNAPGDTQPAGQFVIQ